MKVKELIEWLSNFEDQDAEVEVIEHTSGTGYYDQGGNIRIVKFDPNKHTDYTNLVGNPYIKPDSPRYNSRTLLLGSYE